VTIQLARTATVVALLLFVSVRVSPAEERWALTTWSGQLLSVHANRQDCNRTLQARTQPLRDLMRRERDAGNPPPESVSSYMCVQEIEAIDLRGARGK